ncbi:MAG: ABC transporter permease [Cytophagales bacterium]|nr:ABC transporter permease [Cytophagales bacterium]
MTPLKGEQIQWMQADLERRGLLYPPLREEITDHLSEAVEARMADGLSFMDAYGQVLASFEPRGVGTLNQETLRAIGPFVMLKNYLKIALRNLRRHKLSTTIHLLGLGLGMASALLLLIYLQDELGYDRYHQKADRIFRLTTRMKTPGSDMHVAYAWVSVGEDLEGRYPEVEESVRLLPYQGKLTVRYGKKQFEETRYCYADPSVFAVFTHPFLMGDPKTALAGPNTVVLTRTLAERYFGSHWQSATLIGKTIDLNGEPFRVSGIMEDLPRQSDFSFQALLPGDEEVFNDWAFTYLLLRSGKSLAAFEAKLPEYIREHLLPQFGQDPKSVSLQMYPERLPDVHFVRGALYDTPKGNRTYVYVFSAVLGLLLLIVGSNYVNLTIAQAAGRLKEIGVRKVVGAARRQLVVQFLSESVLLCAIALLLALGLTALLLPVLGQVTDKSFTIRELGNGWTVWGMLGLLLVLGIVAGGYPALYLSAFRPVPAMKGKVRLGKPRLQRVLVVGQFTITIALLSSTLLVYQQMRYVQRFDLGFRQEQVLVVDVAAGEAGGQAASGLKEALLAAPGVRQVASGGGGARPGTDISKDAFYLEGNGPEHMQVVSNLGVDEGYLPLLRIPLLAGRNFKANSIADVQGAFIVNEALVKALGWGPSPRQALGRKISAPSYGREGVVVGVVKDFHLASLHNRVEPLILMHEPGQFANVFVGLEGSGIPATLARIEAVWKAHLPEQAFAYRFLDASFEGQYQQEQRLLRVFAGFTGLTLLVACLGLFGLVSFAASQRTKEIGIRKVMGATNQEILYRMTLPFLLLVALALLVAVPLAWYTMRQWLEGFAYRVPIMPPAFVLSGLLVLAVAGLAVGYHALRATAIRPADALRYE